MKYTHSNIYWSRFLFSTYTYQSWIKRKAWRKSARYNLTQIFGSTVILSREAGHFRCGFKSERKVLLSILLCVLGNASCSYPIGCYGLVVVRSYMDVDHAEWCQKRRSTCKHCSVFTEVRRCPPCLSPSLNPSSPPTLSVPLRIHPYPVQIVKNLALGGHCGAVFEMW